MFVIFAFSYIGVFSYILFWETKLKKKHQKRSQEITDILEKTSEMSTPSKAIIGEEYRRAFTLAAAINNNQEVAGNTLTLTESSADALKSMIQDIDMAQETLHIAFYIWLDDTEGLQVLEAVKRAAKRWVKCRIMLDGMGSKKLIAHKQWKSLKNTTIDARVIFSLKNILKTLLHSRVDIRNHRKIIVIDNILTYCGSQNCCGEDFYIKPKYAPWVDIMLRVQGWLVLQNQKLFVNDWYMVTGQDISKILGETNTHTSGTTVWVTIGTGPT
jgi:cardiolipin synthase